MIQTLLASLMISILVVGCATLPDNIALPIDHPANPQAEEGVFLVPPNPLAADKDHLAQPLPDDGSHRHHLMDTEKHSPEHNSSSDSHHEHHSLGGQQ